jgi:BMFP domain-containing protein YqiC
MAFESVRGYVGLASGLTELTRDRALEAARGLLAIPAAGIASGGKVAVQAAALADELISAAATNRSDLRALVRSEVDIAITRLGLVSVQKLDDVQAEAARLRAEVARLRATSATSPAAKTASRTSPAAKTSSRPSTASKAASKTAQAARKAQSSAPVKKAQSSAPVKKAQSSAPVKKAQSSAPVKKAQSSAPVKKAAKASAPRRSSVTTRARPAST